MVSVIITTKNESSHIGACLTSVKCQTYRHIETIVVDNNSADQTKEIAKGYNVRVFNKGPERSAQRNFGARLAKGKYLLFLDADMELTPTVVEECVNVMRQKTMSKGQKEHFKALVIPEQSLGIGFWAACKALERSFYLGVPWIESARFFRKEEFIDSGGYDEELTGPEDFEFPQRFKKIFGQTSVGRISSFILHNEGKLSLAKILRKKYHYGRKMWEYKNRFASKGYFDKQANILSRYTLFFCKPGELVKHPIIFIGMIILKTLEMSAIFFGALSVYR